MPCEECENKPYCRLYMEGRVECCVKYSKYSNIDSDMLIIDDESEVE